MAPKVFKNRQNENDVRTKNENIPKKNLTRKCLELEQGQIVCIVFYSYICQNINNLNVNKKKSYDDKEHANKKRKLQKQKWSICTLARDYSEKLQWLLSSLFVQNKRNTTIIRKHRLEKRKDAWPMIVSKQTCQNYNECKLNKVGLSLLFFENTKQSYEWEKWIKGKDLDTIS